MNKKQKIKNIVIDANKKSKGIPDHMIDTLDKSYHFIEELCVSAHALSIHREFLKQYTPEERDKLTRLCNRITDIIEVETPQTAFTAIEILFVNNYGRLFDMGIVSIFNEVKMEREAVAHQIRQLRKDKQTTVEPATKHPNGVEVA